MDNKKYFDAQQAKVTNEWLSADSKRASNNSMIYLNHNIMKNYNNANGNGDEKMKSDILTSEIAKLIHNNPRRVVELLNESGLFRIAGIPRKSKLVKYVSRGLHKSKKFAKSIAAEIAMGGGRYSGDGEKPKTDIGATIGSVSDLVSGLGDIFGGKKKAKKAEAEALKAKYEAEKALHEKTKALGNGGKKDNTMIYIVVGVVVFASVIGTVMYMRK